MNEIWNVWNFYHLEKCYFEFYRFSWNYDETIIELKDEEISIKLIFHTDDVLSFRQCDESDRLKTVAYVCENYGKHFLDKWPFYIIKNSNYIKWLNEEKYNTLYGEDVIKHLCIVTCNDIIDLLIFDYPILEINRKNQ